VVCSRCKLWLIAPPNAKRWRHLGWLLLVSLPTLAIAVMARGAATPAASGPNLGERLLLAPALIFAGPGWRCGVFAALAAAGLGRGLWAVLNKRAKPIEGALTLASALFLLAGILLPTHMPGWDYAGPRFLPSGALFALALLPSERLIDQSLNVRRTVTGVVAIFLAANFSWQTLYSCDLWQRCADGLAALAAPVKRSGNRFPIILNPDVGLHPQSSSALVPFALPLRNFGALFALEQGGHVPYFFAGIAALHPHLRVEGDEQLAPAPSQFLVAPLYGPHPVDPRERSMILNYMLSYGVNYEDVVVSGTADDLVTTLGRGFVSDYQNDSVVIARFKGCPAKLRIEQALPHPLLISFGWFPSMEPSAEVRLPASQGAVTVDLAQAPCGTIWLRVIADADNSGTLTPGDGSCARAAPDGIFLAALQSQPQVINCIVRGSP